MAYSRKKRDEILQGMLESIERDDNVLFIDDVIAGSPISKNTFYEWFPKDSEQYKAITTRLAKNRIKVKKYIRLKLRLSGKAAELLALYRMICTEDERRAIATNYTKADMTSDGKRIEMIVVGNGSDADTDTEKDAAGN